MPLTAALGTTQFFACAVDNDGVEGSAVGTSVVVTNVNPTIAGFTVTPTPVTQPADITLTATGVVNPDGDGLIAWVRFYEDVNKNGAVDASDLLLGAGTASGSTYSLTLASSALAQTGQVRILAIAQDNDGGTSAAKGATVTVNPATA